jgi:hypothetical protein
MRERPTVIDLFASCGGGTHNIGAPKTRTTIEKVYDSMLLGGILCRS